MLVLGPEQPSHDAGTGQQKQNELQPAMVLQGRALEQHTGLSSASARCCKSGRHDWLGAGTDGSLPQLGKVMRPHATCDNPVQLPLVTPNQMDNLRSGAARPGSIGTCKACRPTEHGQAWWTTS